MPKQFPLEIVIAATDKASAAIKHITDRVDRVNEPFARLSKNLGKLTESTGLARVGTALAGVGTAALDTTKRIAFGFAAATTAVGLFTYRTAMAADEIGDVAARLNVSTNALQAWTYGFEQADVAPEALNSSLDTLNKNLGLAKIGMGKALPLFRGLGLDPKKFKTLDDLLPALADRLSRISDPVKRSAIATKLLGDAGSQMALKLAEGPKALRDMEEAARAVGAVIDPGVVENAGKFDMVWKSLRATFKGVAGNVMGELYPSIIDLTKALQRFLLDHRDEIKEWAKNFGEKLPDNIKKLSASFDRLRAAVQPIADVFKFFVDNIGLANTVLLALSVTIGGSLIGALFNLGIALAGLGISLTAAFLVPAAIIAGLGVLIYIGWQIYKNWDNITRNIRALWDRLVAGLKQNWEDIKLAAVAAFDWIYDRLQNHPLFLIFKGMRWAFGQIGSIGGSGPVASAAPIGAGVSLAQPRQKVEVKVDLSNLPTGTRADASATDGVLFDLSRGWAMPGVQ